MILTETVLLKMNLNEFSDLLEKEINEASGKRLEYLESIRTLREAKTADEYELRELFFTCLTGELPSQFDLVKSEDFNKVLSSIENTIAQSLPIYDQSAQLLRLWRRQELPYVPSSIMNQARRLMNIINSHIDQG